MRKDQKRLVEEMLSSAGIERLSPLSAVLHELHMDQTASSWWTVRADI